MVSGGPSQVFATGAANALVQNKGESSYGMTDAKKALLFCTILAFQFGLQPAITSRCLNKDLSKSSVVTATEVTKIIIAIFGVTKEEIQVIKRDWSLKNSLQVAALPAILYAMQNVMVQYAYLLLDGMTFNLLNQTKTISAAVWLYFILNKSQSLVQIFALVLLLAAAVLLNMPMGAGASLKIESTADYQLGVSMVLGASMLSGLSAALTQRALTNASPRPALFFSAELAAYGILFLLVTLCFSEEGSRVYKNGIQTGWDAKAFVPVLFNAFGGIIVGLVTKYAGGVRKGFALIAGIIITGFVQWALEGKELQTNSWVAVGLVSLSIYLHASYPPKSILPPKPDKKEL